ncbi:MAG: hypothetical protein HYY64_01885 [Candidatus Rokubacteria bacterium]|nr:hypothetical protein [Candidatus Rokubacteria bacterium]
MNRTMKRLMSVVVVAALLATGCVTYDGQLAMETFGRGLAGLILSPFMIVAGIAQGLAFLPYTIGTGLAELNRGLLQAHAVTLDDSYKATFGVSTTDPRVNPQTGEIAGESGLYGRYRPEAMAEATKAFQRLLVSQGMPEEKARHYVLTGVYTHTRSRNHILLAVVYRHPGMQSFRVASKHTGIVTTFRSENMGWREAYDRDVNGQIVDEVIDWAGIEYSLLRQDKIVATLMVLAAESVKTGKRSPDYWQVERRWMAGETTQIIQESMARVKLDTPRNAQRS